MPTQAIIDSLKLKQNELMHRIEAIEKDVKKGRSADFAEQTTERENDEVLDRIYLEAKHELVQVNQALDRVAKDQYGLCQQCEEPIAVERLSALPYTTTCINCAK